MSPSSVGAFETVANKDYLSLFEGAHPKYKSVVDTLDFSAKDIASAAKLPINSVRLDERIPKELSVRIREWAVLLNLVAGHFKGDLQRTVSWFTVANPLLGEISPRDMIRIGRYRKLHQFVLHALAENRA